MQAEEDIFLTTTEEEPFEWSITTESPTPTSGQQGKPSQLFSNENYLI